MGSKIKARGIYRDPVRSSHGHFVKASGLRWLSVMLLPDIPWAGRVWGLPYLPALDPSERYAKQHQRRHKKLTDWASGPTFRRSSLPNCLWRGALRPFPSRITASNRASIRPGLPTARSRLWEEKLEHWCKRALDAALTGAQRPLRRRASLGLAGVPLRQPRTSPGRSVRHQLEAQFCRGNGGYYPGT
jgi:hypothetical protein